MTMTEDELRRRVSAAYDDVLQEPVPDRLASLLAPPDGKVVDLQARRQRRGVGPLTWAQLGGIAASVLAGIAIGLQLPSLRGGGDVVVGERLARALDTQLASTPDAAMPAQVQLSFVDRGGRYCRTFTAGDLAGLACRAGSHWDLVAAAPAQPGGSTSMRQAASALPRGVLDAVDARIAGNALDAAQERAARDRGWRR